MLIYIIYSKQGQITQEQKIALILNIKDREKSTHNMCLVNIPHTHTHTDTHMAQPPSKCLNIFH